MSETSALATPQDPVTELEHERNLELFRELLQQAKRDKQTDFKFQPTIRFWRLYLTWLSRPGRVDTIKYEIAVAISKEYLGEKGVTQIDGIAQYSKTVMRVTLAPPRS